jgi:mRNA interferase RelE/StbE
MNWEFEVVLSPKALRNLKRLDRNIQKQIKVAINKLAKYPPKCHVIKLRGGSGSELRLRVGDWWIIFEYDFSQKQVNVLTIKHRGKAYKK